MNKEAMGRLILEASTGMHGDVAKQLVDAWAAQAEEAQALREKLDEVHAWIVCSAIASPEDMMQSASRIEEITRPQ
jgi:hypothetical protein